MLLLLRFVSSYFYRIYNGLISATACYCNFCFCVDAFNCMLCMDPDPITHVWPRLEYAFQSLDAGYIKDVKLLERI